MQNKSIWQNHNLVLVFQSTETFSRTVDIVHVIPIFSNSGIATNMTIANCDKKVAFGEKVF